MFIVITPTYKRAKALKRAIDSVLTQTIPEREAVQMIIVNDSPDDASYAEVAAYCAQEKKITYLINPENKGVNFSRNRALDSISSELSSRSDTWIILLDDDDYLAPDALSNFKKLIAEHPAEKWFMTNRAYADGKSLTAAPQSDTRYTYFWDYLFGKKLKGDATHCMHASLVQRIRFSKHIKQGEEWLFFYQLGQKTPIFYSSHNSTLSDGYDSLDTGLNFRKRSKGERLAAIKTLYKEGQALELKKPFTLLLYLGVRLVLVLLKK